MRQMEIDKKQLEAALDADPRTVSAIAECIADALGIPKEKALAAAGNAPLIRATLAGMSSDDISRLLSMLGKDKAERIIACINEKNG